jgi:serine/threonine protein kinase
MSGSVTSPTSLPPATPPAALVIPPNPGETISSELTRNTYTIGEKLGEGFFGLVFSCVDVWNNQLAVKVLKGTAPYHSHRSCGARRVWKVGASTPSVHHIRFRRLSLGRETIYIVTERCYCPLSRLFAEVKDFDGKFWIKAVARCLLQAVHYIHLNGYVHQDIHINNVFAAFARDEILDESKALHFKLGDLGVAKLFSEIDATNTRAQWMLPPEVLDTKEFGPMDYRIDIYHCGLLFLHLLNGGELKFTTEEVLAGMPRQLALQLPAPYNVALEKALRRHVAARTASAMELWQDLNSSPALSESTEPEQMALPTTTQVPDGQDASKGK